jgi:hypothetical protein
MRQPLRHYDLNPDSKGMTLEAFISTRGDVELVPFNPDDGFQVGTVQGSWATTQHFGAVYPLLVACAKARHADFVGYWYEEETGLYHIDPSRYVTEGNYKRAIKLGKDNDQISIWSYMAECEVRIHLDRIVRFREMV